MSELKSAISRYVEAETPQTAPDFEAVRGIARRRALRRTAAVSVGAAATLTAAATLVNAQLGGGGRTVVATTESVPSSDFEGSQEERRIPSDAEAQAYLFRFLRNGAHSPILDAECLEATVDLRLPNTLYRFERDGLATGPVNPVVVYGRVIAVEPGYGGLDRGERSIRVAFTDERAHWRTIQLTLEVDRQIGLGEPVGETVGIDFTIGTTTRFEAMRQAFLSLAPAVYPLGENWSTLADPSASYRITGWGWGAQLMTVDNGVLSVPALTPREESAFLGATDTLAELEAAGLQPTTVVENPVYAECPVAVP